MIHALLEASRGRGEVCLGCMCAVGVAVGVCTHTPLRWPWNGGGVRECCLKEVMLVLRQAMISERTFQAGKELRSFP